MAEGVRAVARALLSVAAGAPRSLRWERGARAAQLISHMARTLLHERKRVPAG